MLQAVLSKARDSTMSDALVSVNVFIDWDSARRVVPPTWRREQESSVPVRLRAEHVEKCFSHLQEKISGFISRVEPKRRIRVIKSKIYHGWHRGLTPTDDRRAWEIAKTNIRAQIYANVSFLPDIEFGDDLSCRGRRVPLRDTLRSRDESSTDEQKMVDTAIVADLLCYSRTESSNFSKGKKPSVMAVVVGDDDDLLPGAFVSEQWGMPIYVLRVTRVGESKYIRTDGIVGKLES